MFSNQDIDYSLNRPCRNIAAVAPPSSSSSSTKKLDTNENDNGWDDDEDYLETSSSPLTSHRFLVGSSIPSVSKLSNANNDYDEGGESINNHSIIEEEDEERTNRLYLLQYHEDSHELTQESSWAHPTGEIWSMACHPTRGDWVVTCGGGAVFSASMMEEGSSGIDEKYVPLTKFQTTLWRLPDLSNGVDNDCEEDIEDEFGLGGTRQRTDSTTSAMKLDPVVTIPHGIKSHQSSNPSGWEQRVGQILWNPLLNASQSSGDALYDLADTSSNDGGGNLITVGWDAAQSPISLWDISSLSDVKEVWSTQQEGGGVASSRRLGRNRFAKLSTLSSALPRRVSWDPHDTHNILATDGVDVLAYDMRVPASSSGLGVIRSAHRYGVTDVCHNHLQSNVVVTSGMDGVMKFWDLRMHLSDGLDPIAMSGGSTSEQFLPPPILKAVRGGHSHWATRATYNPFYDQLVLSGGSDGIANLWRISSCSSAPLLDLDDEEVEDEEADGESSFGGGGIEGENNDTTGDVGDGDKYKQTDWTEDKQPSPKSVGDDEIDKEDSSKSPRSESNANDIRVTRFECSDVTADISWSASDPWVYATLSYDGAIVVHHVPSKEKYKILL